MSTIVFTSILSALSGCTTAANPTSSLSEYVSFLSIANDAPLSIAAPATLAMGYETRDAELAALIDGSNGAPFALPDDASDWAPATAHAAFMTDADWSGSGEALLFEYCLPLGMVATQIAMFQRYG